MQSSATSRNYCLDISCELILFENLFDNLHGIYFSITSRILIYILWIYVAICIFLQVRSQLGRMEGRHVVVINVLAVLVLFLLLLFFRLFDPIHDP